MENIIRVIIATSTVNSNTGIALVNVSNDYQMARLDPLTVKASSINSYRLTIEAMAYFFDNVKSFSNSNYKILFYTECHKVIEDYQKKEFSHYKNIWTRINSSGFDYEIKTASSIMSYVSKLSKEVL